MTDEMFEAFIKICELPLDVLDVSPIAMTAMKWNGFTHLVDCLAFYVQDPIGRAIATPGVRLLMYRDVFPALVAQGYWRALEGEGWWLLRTHYQRRYSRVHMKLWRGQYRNFYEIPLEELVPPTIIEILGTGGLNPMHCMRMAHTDESFPLARPQHRSALIWVTKRLKALDFWTCFADPDTDWLVSLSEQR
jgi:hypothetical protein